MYRPVDPRDLMPLQQLSRSSTKGRTMDKNNVVTIPGDVVAKAQKLLSFFVGEPNTPENISRITKYLHKALEDYFKRKLSFQVICNKDNPTEITLEPLNEFTAFILGYLPEENKDD